MSSPLVLIADDDRELGQILARRMEGLGLEVRLAFNALEALNLAHAARPDLICLDVNMPGGNGLCVSEMLAHDEQLSSVPVIILSGRTDGPVVRKCHELCNFYVPKCPDVWQRIEPLLREILSTSPAAAG